MRHRHSTRQHVVGKSPPVWRSEYGPDRPERAACRLLTGSLLLHRRSTGRPRAWKIPLLCESLGCSSEEATAMASGEMDISPERVSLLATLVQALEVSSGLPLDALEGGALPQAVAGGDDDDDASATAAELAVPSARSAAAFGPDFQQSSAGDSGLDLDGDGVADVSLVGLGGASRPGLTWRQEEEHRRDALRNGRALAVMTMFRIGLTHQEYVAAIGTVARFELALIGHFREAVPDPSERWDAKRRFREIERRLARLRWVEMEQKKEFGGFRGLFNKARGRRRVTGKEMYEKMEAVPDPSERWDAKRRFREIERRLARLRWVEMEQEKEFGGFRGLFNKARGRRRVTGKEMYEKMIADADDLVMAMAERRPADEISYVMQFGGMPEGRRALP